MEPAEVPRVTPSTSTVEPMSRAGLSSLLGPIPLSTIPVKSTWLELLNIGSTSVAPSPGGGHTPSWDILPVSLPRARMRASIDERLYPNPKVRLETGTTSPYTIQNHHVYAPS
ncbi:hypothetical protein PILCRDRAFT_1935 [Piloderma croceum F 1598]|uniref:Uncharacterized protein n=1 Tax=Piloderma croceum (strain F 1598) TaxID=765440 RepID=A0A0C3BSW3_PILCF|nr:hypothetical protein PILCRDRAFT_1935 [Piloderma croceum F 1598]